MLIMYLTLLKIAQALRRARRRSSRRPGTRGGGRLLQRTWMT